MVALSRPRSARRAGQGNVSAAKATASSSGAAGAVAVSLRTSKSQPNALTSSSHVVRGQPASAGGKAVPYAGGTYGVDRSMTTAGKQAGKDKVLNWFRLPNGEGWVPAARTGHTAVIFNSNMFIFGGVVNGVRVNELASFDLSKRAWRRLIPNATARSPEVKAAISSDGGSPIPTPRAYHVSWTFDSCIFVHGGEGPSRAGATDCTQTTEIDDVLAGVGHDPFAEEDGGAPLEPGRVRSLESGGVTAITCRGSESGAGGDSCAEKRPTVSVLEDLWKYDIRTLRWERLSSRLAPLGRKGHTATVAPFRGQPRVFVFGGSPVGRRGLSNALHSVELPRLSAGEGTWERHRPQGTAPTPRQGHSLTAVAGGKRLVLFGGMGESGRLLGDVQILELDGGSLSWACIKVPVGDIPAFRHGHTVCEAPTAAMCAAGQTARRGGTGESGSVLVFGGEGRATEGPEILPTNSHEAFHFDIQASRWQAVEMGHAFPIGRHGHTMVTVSGWTPPSFHPDGTLTAAETTLRCDMAAGLGAKPWTASATAERGRHGKDLQSRERVSWAGVPAAGPSEAATFQWGNNPPSCAVIFGGLNFMYVKPEVWILPLRWREKTVQFSPPVTRDVGRGSCQSAGADGARRTLDVGSIADLKRKAAAAAAWARGNTPNASTAHAHAAAGEVNRRGTRIEHTAHASSIDNLRQHGNQSGGGGAGVVKDRRASLPAGFGRAAAPAVDTDIDHHQRGVWGGVLSNGEVANGMSLAVTGQGGDDGAHTVEPPVEIEAEMIRQRRLVYMAEQKLSAEVSRRMQLEEMNSTLRKEVEELRSSNGTVEAQLREQIKHQWRDGQTARARCAGLERLLAEAYELINMTELQHHLQVKTLMPELYGHPRLPSSHHAGTQGQSMPNTLDDLHLDCRDDTSDARGRHREGAALSVTRHESGGSNRDFHRLEQGSNELRKNENESVPVVSYARDDGLGNAMPRAKGVKWLGGAPHAV